MTVHDIAVQCDSLLLRTYVWKCVTVLFNINNVELRLSLHHCSVPYVLRYCRHEFESIAEYYNVEGGAKLPQYLTFCGAFPHLRAFFFWTFRFSKTHHCHSETV